MVTCQALASPAVKTVLFVGAGRHQRRAIKRARELGFRVVAADANPEAPGFAEADEAEAVGFDVPALTALARDHSADGVVTVASDRAVPIVAAVAEELGLPTIGTEVAHRMKERISMRRCVAGAAMPPGPFAEVRAWQDWMLPLQNSWVPARL